MTVDNGITGGLDTTLPIAMTIGAFTAIAWYNSVELNVLIWMTFKRRKGLYFYSLLIASWGVTVYSLSFLMKFFQVWKNNYVSVTFITIGWYCMVTGQSFVLYSRLHLIVRDARKIKWILYMIITDVFLFHVPTTVMTFGANSNQAAKFAPLYAIMEKIQVTAFCIQEFTISGLYVYETRRILKPGETFQKKRTRQVMRHLIYVNVLIIIMDVILLCTEYADQYEIQTTFKGAVYSVKLRLEFSILNQLMQIAQGGVGSRENPNSVYSHSAAREMALETFHVNNKPNAANNLEVGANAQKSYSVFAGKGKGKPGAHRAVDEGFVIKTTEVTVHDSEIPLDKDLKAPAGESDDSITSINVGPRVPSAAANRLNHVSQSPASSEIEFAGHGA